MTDPLILALLATFFSASLIAIASRSDRRRRAMPVRVVELPSQRVYTGGWSKR